MPPVSTKTVGNYAFLNHTVVHSDPSFDVEWLKSLMARTIPRTISSGNQTRTPRDPDDAANVTRLFQRLLQPVVRFPELDLLLKHRPFPTVGSNVTPVSLAETLRHCKTGSLVLFYRIGMNNSNNNNNNNNGEANLMSIFLDRLQTVMGTTFTHVAMVYREAKDSRPLLWHSVGLERDLLDNYSGRRMTSGAALHDMEDFMIRGKAGAAIIREIKGADTDMLAQRIREDIIPQYHGIPFTSHSMGPLYNILNGVRKPVADELTKFCGELCTTTLQDVGVLGPNVDPSTWLPGVLSSDFLFGDQLIHHTLISSRVSWAPDRRIIIDKSSARL